MGMEPIDDDVSDAVIAVELDDVGDDDVDADDLGTDEPDAGPEPDDDDE